MNPFNWLTRLRLKRLREQLVVAEAMVKTLNRFAEKWHTFPTSYAESLVKYEVKLAVLKHKLTEMEAGGSESD